MRRRFPGIVGMFDRTACAVFLIAVLSLAAGTAGAGARPAGRDAASSCSTSLELGFGPFLEKNPPTANYELRGVVHPACNKAPQGSCVAEAREGSKYVKFETVPVLPSSGRCRFILSLLTNFKPTTVRVRYLPAAGFGASRASLGLAPDKTVPFPADLGATGGSSTTTPTPPAPTPAKGTRIEGIAFIDSSQGIRTLPAGTHIYPPGSTVTGATGCQTTPTDGQLVLVFDYSGRPVAGSIDLTVPDGSGGSYQHAPIEMDVNPGQTVQFLGDPLPANGKYTLTVELLGLHPQNLPATFTLNRTC